MRMLALWPPTSRRCRKLTADHHAQSPALPNPKALLEPIRLFVLDLDGTFYLGDSLIAGSLDFLAAAERTERRVLFFTNNSSRTHEMYVRKLSALGVPVTRESILTSGDVAMERLKREFPGKSVYLVGTASLNIEFSNNNIPLTSDSQPDIVLVAFDTELTYEKLSKACTYIRGGALFLATHPDINCPTENGFIPDCGSFCAAISLSTGQTPRFFGKPYADTVEAILGITGLKREEIAFIGDRLYTDIAVGVNNGATGILVLSGETKECDIAASDVKPDAVFKNLGEIASFL